MWKFGERIPRKGQIALRHVNGYLLLFASMNSTRLTAGAPKSQKYTKLHAVALSVNIMRTSPGLRFPKALYA